MNQQLVGRLIDPRELEKLCEWPDESIGTMAWLILQEQVGGKDLDVIAMHLDVSNQDVLDVIEGTVNKKGLEALDAWKAAVITLKTAKRINETAIQVGWDSIEALAIDKLHTSLRNQRSNDPEEMLKIATAANHALRRQRGEGGSSPSATLSIKPDGSVDATLRNGDLGFIRLRLSPAIANQIQDPTRVIDGSINKPNSTVNKQMLTLTETREVIDQDEVDAHERTLYREDVTRQNKENRDMINDEVNKMFNKGKYKNG